MARHWSLETLGWSERFAEAFQPWAGEHVLPGRVALEHKHIYGVFSERGELLARASGRLRHQALTAVEYPAVGDWVAVRVRPGEPRATILAVLPRRSRFSRKVAGDLTREQVVAANIDTVFLTMGLDADYNLRRIERYLLTGWESGAQPVVLLNKADLCDEVAARVREVQTVAAGAPVHATSAPEGMGLDVIRSYLGVGKSVALLGSSGVGKSTLINRLVGEDIQRTAGLSADGRRGVHTTTHRELIVLPEGGLVIDTPGLREIQLWDVGESIATAFAEIEALGADCHFGDCGHDSEPRCAVRVAVAEGRLAPDRLESYVRLRREARHLVEKQDQLALIEKKKKSRSVHRTVRQMPRK